MPGAAARPRMHPFVGAVRRHWRPTEICVPPSALPLPSPRARPAAGASVLVRIAGGRADLLPWPWLASQGAARHARGAQLRCATRQPGHLAADHRAQPGTGPAAPPQGLARNRLRRRARRARRLRGRGRTAGPAGLRRVVQPAASRARGAVGARTLGAEPRLLPGAFAPRGVRADGAAAGHREVADPAGAGQAARTAGGAAAMSDYENRLVLDEDLRALLDDALAP